MILNSNLAPPGPICLHRTIRCCNRAELPLLGNGRLANSFAATIEELLEQGVLLKQGVLLRQILQLHCGLSFFANGSVELCKIVVHWELG